MSLLLGTEKTCVGRLGLLVRVVDVDRFGLLTHAEMKLVRCWSNIERVFEELGVTFQEVAVDLELLGGKGWISKIWMQETEY